jgi:hypothetical protein
MDFIVNNLLTLILVFPHPGSYPGRHAAKE